MAGDTTVDSAGHSEHNSGFLAGHFNGAFRIRGLHNRLEVLLLAMSVVSGLVRVRGQKSPRLLPNGSIEPLQTLSPDLYYLVLTEPKVSFSVNPCAAYRRQPLLARYPVPVVLLFSLKKEERKRNAATLFVCDLLGRNVARYGIDLTR